MYFLDTCDWLLLIFTATFKVLTPVPLAFSIFHQPKWMTSYCQWKCYGISKKNERKCATWWWPSTLWYQGVCMHIDSQAWVVHLIVYGTDTWGTLEQLCIIMCFSKSDSDFNYSTEKKQRIWIWSWYISLPDDPKVAEIHNFICFPMHMFFFYLDLTVLKHWHSCEIS